MAPNNRLGGQLMHASIALGVLATISVILRFVARWRSKANFGGDDIFIAISLILHYIMIVINSQAVYKGGFGMPLETLSPSQVSLILKLMMCALCAYSLTITMVKISILLLYRRIFSTAAFRRKTLIVGILCITWFLVAACLEIFQCQPVSDAFIPEMLYTGHCIDIQAYYEGVTATNMAIDIIMLLLPVHMVWGLSLPIRQRILLSSIFMLGGLVCFAAIMRLTKLGVLQKEDVSVTLVAEYMWSEVEAATAIICACMVTYRPLFVNVRQSFLKVSSLFSKGSSVSKGAAKDGWKDLEDATDRQLQRPIGEDLHGRDIRLQDLNANATKDGLHVINISALESDSKQPYTSRSPDSVDAQSKGDISTHHPATFQVTEEQVGMLDPFSHG